ncbi:uroporphyrinogen decarboxylase family protein, partial [Enterococcus faecium]
AAYVVEGGPSKEHLRARGMMHADPEAWHRLAGWLAEVSRAFLAAQIDGGAQAVQLFDSWAGSLSRAAFLEFVAPHSRAALEGIDVPRIHFGVGTGPFLADMRLGGI